MSGQSRVMKNKRYSRSRSEASRVAYNPGALKIKTIDGSDVYVDIKVQYRIKPDEADVIIRTSGPYDAYKEKWTGDYVRTSVRNFLGELTTEEFYDTSKRQQKIVASLQDVRKQLAPYGIWIDSIVIPTKPTFYKEYAEKIKEKKLADQAVLEEQSKALAAKQRQQTMIVEETNRKNVSIEQFSGKMEQIIIEAKAQAEKTRKEADAYFDKVTIGAEAGLYKSEKQAKAIMSKKLAEAKGIQELKNALTGEGGINMVKLEYAKKLKGVVISGKPYTVDARTERFQHIEGAASYKGKK
jgi:regulator of protease activity HflC (stomatin/prohibitin superfamily)